MCIRFRRVYNLGFSTDAMLVPLRRMHGTNGAVELLDEEVRLIVGSLEEADESIYKFVVSTELSERTLERSVAIYWLGGPRIHRKTVFWPDESDRTSWELFVAYANEQAIALDRMSTRLRASDQGITPFHE